MENTVSEAAHTAGWYCRRIEYLSGFTLPERLENFHRVLEMRTRWITVCTENTFHPQNASAILRTCEAFGIQDIYTVESLCKFDPSLNIVKGTDKWIDLHRHPSTTDALRALRGAGYRIVATTPHTGDTSPEDFDVTKGPFALILGTEHAGVSDETIAAADEYMRIPMCGFVESLNVSASAAIMLYILSQKLRESRAAWPLTAEERLPLLFRWLMGSIRDSEGILRRGFPE